LSPTASESVLVTASVFFLRPVFSSLQSMRTRNRFGPSCRIPGTPVFFGRPFLMGMLHLHDGRVLHTRECTTSECFERHREKPQATADVLIGLDRRESELDAVLPASTRDIRTPLEYSASRDVTPLTKPASTASHDIDPTRPAAP
jgi:hypothetical protein